MDDVAALLSQDPSLTAEILRRSNSSQFGAEEPTLDVFDAIMRMGYYEVYQIAVTAFSRKTMAVEKPIGLIKADELWRHSGTTAVLSRLLAFQAGEDEGIAYTAGLLHDIGKMVFALAEGPKYAELMGQVGNSGRALADAERAAFGFDHAAVGARLLERWQVPSDVSMPVAYQHEADLPKGAPRMYAIIALGNILAHHLEKISGKKPFELPEAAAAMAVLHINNNELATLAQRAREEIKTMESLLRMPSG